MKPSEIKSVLEERDIRLTRSLGQNFLHDRHQLDRIVAAAQLGSGDCVLEIGPGLGALTERLMAVSGPLEAVEKDGRLVAYLRERFGVGDERWTLRHADAVDYLRESVRDWREWTLVSNLPYSVGSVILVDLALAERRPKRMVVTVQREVAERLMAKAGTGEYGVLTLLVRLGYEPSDWFRIPAGCFYPEPEVESACVTLERRGRARLSREGEGVYVKLVKQGFSERRKMMYKLLKRAWPESRLEAAYVKAGLDRAIRAEQVTLDQFGVMAEVLAVERDGSIA